jgi:hypothetical protein
MTRLPVSSTSAGERLNAISRVPKPSFATPMKGATRMPYPHDEPPWTPQRIRALFRLFQTSAPPDFQRQILERVAQRQHSHGLRRMGWRSRLAWWPGCRAWGVGRLQSHRRWPGHVITIAGCCGLVVGTSLAWWAMRTGPRVPLTPALLVSRAVSLPRAPGVPTEAPRRGDQHRGFGKVESQEEAGHAASPPESSASAAQMQTGQSVDRSTASQVGDGPERALLVPAPVQRLTAQKERQPPVHRHTQRSGRPRGAPGKSSRPHTRLGTSQQAPG